jgi:hypothetical protein
MSDKPDNNRGLPTTALAVISTLLSMLWLMAILPEWHSRIFRWMKCCGEWKSVVSNANTTIPANSATTES